VHIVDIKCC